MSTYASEILDGHREMVAEFGATITMQGGTVHFPVVLVFPEASQDLLAAGVLSKGTVHFEIERTIAAAAGIEQESILFVTGQLLELHVTAIEEDPGVPIVFVTAQEEQ